MFRNLISIIFALTLLSNCVSMNRSGSDQPPEITKDMTLETGFQLALTYGGNTLEEVKRQVKARKAWKQLERLSADFILSQTGEAQPNQILHAVHLYRVSTPELDPKILEKLFATGDPFYQKIAWQLAALKPSVAVARTLENELSKVVYQGNESQVIFPEMARAVRANQLNAVYSLLKIGLMSNGSDEFAKSMIALDPERASRDFLDYLGKASLEDLRQINQANINIYACLVILRHFMQYPLPIEHPNAGYLYIYAISRNPGLAEMARDVLDQQIPRFREQMAFLLARQPLQVQMAFVEGTRHYPSANVKLMLANFKEMTSYEEVEEEVDALRRF